MVEAEVGDGALFPDREEEWERAAKAEERASAVSEFRKYCREVLRSDVQGLVSASVAARFLGVNEKQVRVWVRDKLLREFRYPTLKMIGIPVKDIMALRATREKSGKEGDA